jgi:NitT/TauT family transport system substrate-binding protein
MLGSVLVVKNELIRDQPELIRALVTVNEDATRWIHDHPVDAANTLVSALSLTGESVMPAEAASLTSELDMTQTTMLRSMKRLEYTTEFSLDDVQEVIDYAARLGYIDRSFPADEIVDLRFMR